MKELKNVYTARELFETIINEKYSDKKDQIKVLAETEHYIAIISKGECLNIIILKGRTENDFLPDIYIEQDYKGFCKAASINWAAYGDQDLKATKEFVNNLQEAMQIVEKISNKNFSEIFNK